jgi:hypothetical protein
MGGGGRVTKKLTKMIEIKEEHGRQGTKESNVPKGEKEGKREKWKPKESKKGRTDIFFDLINP